MRELANKFAALEKEIAAERGEFTLFALFLREDVVNKWDVVLSAPWFGGDERNVLNYLVQKIKSHLQPDEIVMLSRIVPIEPEDKSVKAVNKAVNVEHSIVEVRDSYFFGLQIKHAYIFTSKERNLVSSPAARG